MTELFSNPSRREWLVAMFGAATLPEILAAQEHARQASKVRAPFEYLEPGTAREIEAMAAQIIPTDDTPGAKEAGVIYFIDRALITFEKDKQDTYREGLQQAQAAREKLFPGSATIADLSEDQQIALLKSIEHSDFFQALRFDTIAGFLALPSYGGNHNDVGWKLIGFDGAHSYHPPFGYYDREANEGTK